MRELAKITIDGVRYIVWDELRGKRPGRAGIALLLSMRDGVGADALLVVPENKPLALRAYDSDGNEIPVGSAARRAASLALGSRGALGPKVQSGVADERIERVEVRLTDYFCARLFDAESRSRMAG